MNTNKAPDRIYFPADGLPAYIDWDGSPIRTKQVEDSDICYIRKDALMEWINEARAIPHENAITRDLAFQEVVNKLNSM